MDHNPPQPAPPRAVSIADACASLSVSRMTLGRRIADGSIRVVRLGGRVLVPVAELERLLAGPAPSVPVDVAHAVPMAAAGGARGAR